MKSSNIRVYSDDLTSCRIQKSRLLLEVALGLYMSYVMLEMPFNLNDITTFTEFDHV
jgi:hypothetical protein